MWPQCLPIDTLIGKVLTEVCVSNDKDEILFKVDDGTQYKLCHHRDCCESVLIEDINGDLSDLIGAPIMVAEENTNQDDPPGEDDKYYDASHTWTFYRIATIKGWVIVRWLGQSNGYYSESVDFVKVD